MDQQINKVVNLVFVIAGSLLGYVVFSLLFKLVGVYDLEARVRNVELYIQGIAVLTGIITFLILRLNDACNQYMTEVIAELSRVTWPTVDETYKGTIVTVIMVLISAAILGLLDAAWAWMINRIL